MTWMKVAVALLPNDHLVHMHWWPWWFFAAPRTLWRYAKSNQIHLNCNLNLLFLPGKHQKFACLILPLVLRKDKDPKWLELELPFGPWGLGLFTSRRRLILKWHCCKKSHWVGCVPPPWQSTVWAPKSFDQPLRMHWLHHCMWRRLGSGASSWVALELNACLNW